MIQTYIDRLVEYGLKTGLIEPTDKIYTANRLLELFGLEAPEYDEGVGSLKDCEIRGVESGSICGHKQGEEGDSSNVQRYGKESGDSDVQGHGVKSSSSNMQDAGAELEQILSGMLDYACEKGLIPENSITYRDLFDTKIMGLLVPRPSEVIEKFWSLYQEEPQAATDYYYKLSRDTDYIRRYRIVRDEKWTTATEYGELDITINLSKPEKDPKAIAAAKNAKQAGYPKCLLCRENEGGHYEFAMAKAPEEEAFAVKGFEDVEAGIVKWPMSVIRLSGTDTDRIIALADKILDTWRSYTDEAAFIFAETDGEPHNTITPIARKRGGKYELDLVLRNNITTKEHPLGVYHPHAELHHIKKENIGLIEVMGLAVLPARLKAEMAALRQAILSGSDLRADEALAKHADWVEAFLPKYEKVDASNIDGIIRDEIGHVFLRVLADAGVYKRTPKGREGFRRFVETVSEGQ